MADFAGTLTDRSNAIFMKRHGLLSFWDELAGLYYPARADFVRDMVWGEEFGTDLFDETACVFRRDLGSAFAPMTRPTGTRWFMPTPLVVNPEHPLEPEVLARLQQAADIQRMWMYEPRANFVKCMEQNDWDQVTFGNSPMSVDLRKDADGLIFQCWHLRDCAWTENYLAEIDQLHRKAKPSARQLKQQFGDGALDADIKKACEKDPEKAFEIRHVMMTLDDYEYMEGSKAKQYRSTKTPLHPEGFPYVSVYLDPAHRKIIKEQGSWTFKYVVPRWQRLSGNPYAVSPATTDTLARARLMQVMARTATEAMEKSVDPPASAKETAIRGDVNLYAGGLTWVDRDYDERMGPAMQLFETGKNAILGMQAMDQQRARLAEGMYVSKLTLPDYREKTAYETQQVQEEHLRSSIPLFEPVEVNNAMILEEVFKTLQNSTTAFGREPLWPEELGDSGVWTFTNPLREAAERIKVQTFRTTVEIVQGAAMMRQAGTIDIDTRQAERDAVRATGGPGLWLIPKDTADAEKKKADAMSQLAMLTQGAGAAGQAAEAVGTGAQAMQQAQAA